jgi:hypothetical protein
VRGYLCVFAEEVDEVVGVSGQPGDHCVKVLVDGIDLFGDLALLE